MLCVVPSQAGDKSFMLEAGRKQGQAEGFIFSGSAHNHAHNLHLPHICSFSYLVDSHLSNCWPLVSVRSRAGMWAVLTADWLR